MPLLPAIFTFQLMVRLAQEEFKLIKAFRRELLGYYAKLNKRRLKD